MSTGRPQNTTRLEDLQFMVETGETHTGAAARLGITADALEAWCRDHDLLLWKRLVANSHRLGAGARRGHLTEAIA